MPISIDRDPYKRKYQEILETYKLEQELARKLNNSSQKERIELNLYTKAYDEFFQQLPQNPVIKVKDNPIAMDGVTRLWLKTLNIFLKPNSTFLEIGSGDCSLSRKVSEVVNKVYALDVSHETSRGLKLPDNVESIVSDGLTIPLVENSVDIAYSHQLMEHLHPEDAKDQLANIYRVLAPGGKYVCITPNRLSGPHDTSQFFDDIATGWHLKEYTLIELYELFREIGFSQITYYKIKPDRNIFIPLNLLTVPWLKLTENIIEKLPFTWRRKIALMLLFRGITIVGTK